MAGKQAQIPLVKSHGSMDYTRANIYGNRFKLKPHLFASWQNPVSNRHMHTYLTKKK